MMDAKSKSADQEQTPAYRAADLPDQVWTDRRYTHIHSAVLFADFENSVMISSALLPAQYDELINNYQRAMIALVERLRAEKMQIGEFYTQGDQLTLFFYDPEEVAFNHYYETTDELNDQERRQLAEQQRKRNENLLFCALKAAIFLKNSWHVQQFNLERVLNRHQPYGLGIGLHWGKVFLGDRPDSRRRIEGYSVNLAKRIESASRLGRYSHIMLSRETYNTIRGSVRKHTQLKQRIFFHEHEIPMELMKGIARQQNIYELKFYHLIGIHSTKEAVKQYETMFELDPSNSWAYYQLSDHYMYTVKDWDKLFDLANRAYTVHPHDEKILLDLAKYYQYRKDYAQCREFCEQALKIKESAWWMLAAAFGLGMLFMYLLTMLPRLKKREANPYKEAEALKILYGHMSADPEVEEMVRKLYARKNGDKEVQIDKKILKEMIDRIKRS